MITPLKTASINDGRSSFHRLIACCMRRIGVLVSTARRPLTSTTKAFALFCDIRTRLAAGSNNIALTAAPTSLLPSRIFLQPLNYSPELLNRSRERRSPPEGARARGDSRRETQLHPPPETGLRPVPRSRQLPLRRLLPRSAVFPVLGVKPRRRPCLRSPLVRVASPPGLWRMLTSTRKKTKSH